jgi:hypothetical protein
MLKEIVYKKQKQWYSDYIERPDLEATTHTKLTFIQSNINKNTQQNVETKQKTHPQ